MTVRNFRIFYLYPVFAFLTRWILLYYSDGLFMEISTKGCIMKVKPPFFFLFALLLALASIPLTSYARDLDGENFFSSRSETLVSRVDVQCQQLAGGPVSLSLSLDQPQPSLQADGAQWRLSGESIIGAEGLPDLPAVARWVRVPDRGNLCVSFSVTQLQRLRAPEPRRFHESVEDLSTRSNPENEPALQGLFPAQAVEMSEPMILRGVRVVRLTMYPVQWDAEHGEYIQNLGLEAEINVTPGVGINEVQPQPRCYSHDFQRLLDALLLNPPQRDNPDDPAPGGYLVVMDENAPPEVMEFVLWKRREGRHVETLQVQPAQPPAAIKTAIADNYRRTGFEYLVFMGSDEADPPLTMPMDDNYYDMFYTMLEGNDDLPDVAVGTFNCLTFPNLICALRRAVSYQSQPFNENEDWYTHAAVGVGDCSVPQDLAPSYTGKWISEVLHRNGFDAVETSYYADNEVNDPSRMIEAQYNAGVNFIIVRAHEWNLQVNNIQRTGIYPFHFLVSSGTISPNNNGAFNWSFRMGTPNDMRGPSAGFGHYSSPRTNDANALVGSMIQALFFKGIETYGWARNYALLNLRRLMVADGDQRYMLEAHHWRYYGDPSQWCWRGAPLAVQIQCNDFIACDANSFEAGATYGPNNLPAVKAVAALTQGDRLIASAPTDLNGRTHLVWDYEEDLLDINQPVVLTVTGKGLYPATQQIQVIEPAVWVTVSEYEFVDNRDGVPNPGEAGEVFLTLHNPSGGVSPRLVSLALSSESPWLEIPQAELQANPLNPGDFYRLEAGLPLRILPGCPDGESLVLQATMVGDNNQMYVSSLQFHAVGPSFRFEQTEDHLQPNNQVTTLRLVLKNTGRQASLEMTAVLESLSPFVEIVQPDGRYLGAQPQSLVFPMLNDPNRPFAVLTHVNIIPGMRAQFRMLLNNAQVADTVHFEMPIGAATAGDAFGPDRYGYFALDCFDEGNAFADAFDFNWVEINPNLEVRNFDGVSLELPDEDEPDVTFLVQLPFPLRYYGLEYEEISICSNGWIAVGDQTNLKNQQNWDLPGINGAYGMIAPFWDRLHYEREGDGIYTCFDDDNSRFIIEWVAGVELEGQLSANVFECIISNPYREPTVTWDSPLLFQYNVVNNTQGDNSEANYHCTVGLSSPDGQDGLTYTYWNNYPSSASTLMSGLAILWSTLSYDIPATAFGRITRWIDGTALPQALVQSSDGLSTSYLDNGNYRLIRVSREFNLTVTARGYVEQTAEGLQVEEHGDVEHNFILAHSWLRFNPDTLRLSYNIEPDSILTSSAIIRVANAGNVDCNVSEILSGPLPDFITWSVQPPGPFVLERSQSINLIINFQARGVESGVWASGLKLVNDSPVDTLGYTIIIDALVGAPPIDKTIPDRFNLSEVYPNPFNSTTTISFDIPQRSAVSFRLYDLSGKPARVFEPKIYDAGQYSLALNVEDLPSGAYLLRMTAPGFSATRRALLLR